MSEENPGGYVQGEGEREVARPEIIEALRPKLWECTFTVALNTVVRPGCMFFEGVTWHEAHDDAKKKLQKVYGEALGAQLLLHKVDSSKPLHKPNAEGGNDYWFTAHFTVAKAGVKYPDITYTLVGKHIFKAPSAAAAMAFALLDLTEFYGAKFLEIICIEYAEEPQTPDGKFPAI